MLDYIRIGCAVPAVKVGDVPKNAEDICRYMQKADGEEVDVLLFPELSLTGYSCGDLFFQEVLWSAVKAGVKRIVEASAQYPKLTVVFGLPVRVQNQLYNCAAVVCNGAIRGVVPKTYLPEFSTFSEKRWFSSAKDLDTAQIADVFGLSEFEYTTVGNEKVFPLGEGAVLGVEICEDLYSPIPVSTWLCMGGANVIVNLSASPYAAGKRDEIRNVIRHQSASQKCIYAYCGAGYTESTSDMVFSGQAVVAECGKLLNENDQQLASDYLLIQDCDLGRIAYDRMQNTTFRDAVSTFGCQTYLEGSMQFPMQLRGDGTRYALQKNPFVPNKEEDRYARCKEVFSAQVVGLMQRLSVIGANAVIGISGGLDSTLALLVVAEAMRRLNRPLTDVYCVTMPCFGTSDRTYQNALTLMRTLGVSSKEINIRDAVTQHFADIGHDPSVHNATYENAQARERTQILMDYAGAVGGIVVGTGDLSELALGWCTYNGDHMSMYSVNADVPKTLIPYIIDAVAQEPAFAECREVLQDIIDTPISPELLPPDAQGKISQQTEDLVGPYALHDFFLYYVLRYGFRPEKVYRMACRAFADEFDGETVKKWLKTFYRRFFTQQFKRNCLPDGVKIGSVGLGPRGDWKMPSDASARIWLEEAENL